MDSAKIRKELDQFQTAIKKLSKVTKAYDFCGSMHEEVEYSNRQFGTIQTPYFKISKYIKPIAILKEICKT